MDDLTPLIDETRWTQRYLSAICLLLVLIVIQLVVVVYAIRHQSRVEVVCAESVQCEQR